MTRSDDYRYGITLIRADGSRVDPRGMTIDWDPALEWARFEALRRRAGSGCVTGTARIEPVWLNSRPPEVDGFRVRLTGGSESLPVVFPKRYFDGAAKRAGAASVEAGELAADEVVRYSVTAFPAGRHAVPKDLSPLDVDEIATLPPIEEVEPGGIDFGTGVRRGAFDPTDIPVVVEHRVVEEVRAGTSRSRGAETGGFLLGHLSRERRAADIVVRVTAQLEAEHTLSELTRLTFTPQTWTDLRRRMNLRNRNESLLGWWHSHPVRDWTCQGCPAERQRVCPLAGDFFSEHDRALHRTVFASAYMLGMVANDIAFSEMTFSMFGWRRGLVEARGFYLTRGSNPAPALETVSAEGGPDGCQEPARYSVCS